MAVPNTFVAGSTILASAVNENFSYVDGRVSALNQDNFTAATRLPNSIFANPNTVVVLPMHIGLSGWIDTSGYVNSFVTIPYDSTEGAASYNLIAGDANWKNASGAGTSAELAWGYFAPSGTGVSAFTRITSIAYFTPTSTSGVAGGYGTQAISGLPQAFSTSASVRGGFAVRAVGGGGAFVAASGGDNMTVTLKLIRALRG